jgi:transposase InsO family protein
VAAVVDLFSRRVVGWSMNAAMTAQLVTDALVMAIWRIGAFPDGQSCLNLAAARLRYIAGTTWSAKCYLNMRPLYQQQQSETEAVA